MILSKGPPKRAFLIPAEAPRIHLGVRGDGPFNRRKINLSQVFAGQTVGVKKNDDRIWLVSFMNYDLGYFDGETCGLQPLANPFGPKALPMSPV